MLTNIANIKQLNKILFIYNAYIPLHKLTNMNDVFNACVDALYFAANLFGITYEEINVIVFCVAWPILTIFLIYKAYFHEKSKA